MKITRYAARRIFHIMETANVCSLDDKDLEAVIVNFNAFRKVAEEFESLKLELFQKVYGETEKKSDEEKQRLQNFFGILKSIEHADMEEKVRLDAVAKETYPDLYDLRNKELKVIIAILNKEVDVNVEKVNGDDFIKCLLKGRKDMSVGEIYKIFAPMLETTERTATSSEEIEQLLK